MREYPRSWQDIQDILHWDENKIKECFSESFENPISFIISLDVSEKLASLAYSELHNAINFYMKLIKNCEKLQTA